MRTVALVLVAACGSPRSQPAPVKLVDATSFRAMLDDTDYLAKVRELRIVPLGHHVARYLVFRTDGMYADEIDAEYPGSFIGRIEHARISYKVDPEESASWPHTTHELRDMQAAELHAALAGDKSTAIENVMIEPLDGDQARYVITWKTTNRRDAVVASFPGELVDEMVAAHVMYGVRAPSLELP